MEKIKKLKGHFCLPLPWALLLLFLGSLGICLVMFFFSPGSLTAFLRTCFQTPTLFLWNWLPVLFLLLLLWFLSGNTIFSLGVTGILGLIFAAVNRYKVLLRQDPFLPSDLTLAKETLEILKGFDSLYRIAIFVAIALLVLLIGVSLYFFRDNMPGKNVRFLGIFTLLLVGFYLNSSVYADEALYDSYAVEGNIYFNVNQYVSKGFLFSFIKDINAGRVEKPEGYNESFYAQEEAAYSYADYTEQKKPHVIMIMGEAYTDISNYDAFDFTGYTDPMLRMKNILSDENTVSGHIIVPNFGGGTSDTEFDVLTACPTRYVGGNKASFSYIRNQMESLPSLLKTQGYQTLAIHPGFPWFYNRANVYNNLGFDTFYHLENSFVPETQNKGGYISDEATGDLVLKTFEKNLQESDSPLFSFTVTIQNHGPFDEKYNDLKKNFETTIPLSSTEEAILSGYFQGIADADILLGRLTEYFSASDEPVVVVFFGDHLPGFPGAFDLFEKLGLPIHANGAEEEQLNVYKTPFFIWQNNAAKTLNDITRKQMLPESGLISANYLGSMTLSLLGMDGLSPLMDFSNQLLQALPVLTLQTFMDDKGNYLHELTASQQADLETLKGYTYYHMFR